MALNKLRNNPFQHFVGIEIIELGGGKSVLQLELKDHPVSYTHLTLPTIE